jgi:hypothetical protein
MFRSGVQRVGVAVDGIDHKGGTMAQDTTRKTSMHVAIAAPVHEDGEVGK